MIKNISVLSNSKHILLNKKPFPYIVIKNALPQALADQLTFEFPIKEFNLSGNNKRRDISYKEVKASIKISHLWKEFISYHSSEYFFKEVLEAFKTCIPEKDYLNYLDLKVGKRGIDKHKDGQILLDSQISINTPVQSPSSVRKAHVDNTNKLFSGLYYLRRKEDDSQGGDLNLLEWDNSYSYKKKLKYYQEDVQDTHFSVFDTVKYENNVAIIFLNSIEALHLVTERDTTIHTRCFVNLIGELSNNIFSKERFSKRVINSSKTIIRNFYKK